MTAASRTGGTAARNPRRGSRLAPLYHQLYVLLREGIDSGRFPAGEPLPSEPALAARFSVSRITVRRTLEQLSGEGLVRKVRGVGTFPVAAPAAQGPASISGYLETLISIERGTTADLLDWTLIDCPPPLAEALASPRALRVVRLRRHRGVPISETTIHLPEHLAHLVHRETAGSEPLIHLLEAQGIIAERTEQVITAVAAGPLVAERLGVAPGSPLIAMRRLMRDGDGAAVLHQESLYAPDRFEYRMTLTRTTVGPVARWTPIG